MEVPLLVTYIQFAVFHDPAEQATGAVSASMAMPAAVVWGHVLLPDAVAETHIAIAAAAPEVVQPDSLHGVAIQVIVHDENGPELPREVHGALAADVSPLYAAFPLSEPVCIDTTPGCPALKVAVCACVPPLLPQYSSDCIAFTDVKSSFRNVIDASGTISM